MTCDQILFSLFARIYPVVDLCVIEEYNLLHLWGAFYNCT